VDTRAGLDDLEKRKFLNLPGLELQQLGHPARIPTALSRLFEICSRSNIYKRKLTSTKKGGDTRPTRESYAEMEPSVEAAI
jgi:hypothetical protein